MSHHSSSATNTASPSDDARPPVDLRTIRRASVIAGSSLLLMAGLAGFGYVVVIEGLVTYDSADRTATAITGSSGLFLAGIVSLFMVVALDMVVAWGLFHVLAPVSRTLSAIAAWTRVVYGGIFAVAVAELVGVLRVLSTAGGTAADTALRHTEALTGVNRFAEVYDAALILFGLHLLVVGWLASKAHHVPTWLAVLVVVSGGGYVFDGLVAVVSATPWTEVSMFTFVGELLLALWLVIAGRRIKLSEVDHG